METGKEEGGGKKGSGKGRGEEGKGEEKRGENSGERGGAGTAVTVGAGAALRTAGAGAMFVTTRGERHALQALEKRFPRQKLVSVADRSRRRDELNHCRCCAHPLPLELEGCTSRQATEWQTETLERRTRPLGLEQHTLQHWRWWPTLVPGKCTHQCDWRNKLCRRGRGVGYSWRWRDVLHHQSCGNAVKGTFFFAEENCDARGLRRPLLTGRAYLQRAPETEAQRAAVWCSRCELAQATSGGCFGQAEHILSVSMNRHRFSCDRCLETCPGDVKHVTGHQYLNPTLTRLQLGKSVDIRFRTYFSEFTPFLE